MGLLDGRSASYSGTGTGGAEIRRKSSHHGGSTRGFSPTRSVSSSKGYYVRPAASSSSQRRTSSSGFFNFGGSRGFSGSSYRRSPRSGYINYLWHRLQRMIRELWAYARRHPMKAFFAVVVPLVSAGGAIHGLMRQFGVKVPGLDGGMRRGGGGFYGSRGYSSSGGGGGGGWMDQAGGLMQIAKAFI